MKFRVDAMPQYPDTCPFCERYWKEGKYYNICKIDGGDCDYFSDRKRDPLNCRWLIDGETENELQRKEG